MSFSDILLHLRMERACYLLKNTDLSVEDTSLKIGYENPNHFYRQFKIKYGTTPSKYRKTAEGK